MVKSVMMEMWLMEMDVTMHVKTNTVVTDMVNQQGLMVYMVLQMTNSVMMEVLCQVMVVVRLVN